MGQVRQQAAKHTMVTLIATALSAIATITVYAQERELYGLLGFLMDTALLFSPFILLSSSAVLQKFFPVFEQKEGQNSLFTLGLTVISAGALVFIPLFFLFKNYVLPKIPSYLNDQSALEFFNFILPIAIVYAFVNYLFSYSSIFKKVAIPVVFQISNKFFVPLIVLLYYLNHIETKSAVYLLVAIYLLSLLGMLLYLNSLKIIRFGAPFKVFEKIKLKEYVEFSSFSLFTVFGKQLVMRIDGFMVTLMFTVGLNGEYRIAAFMAGIILIPFNSIASLMAPMIAKAWKNADLSEINKMYADSSKHSLIVGLFFFLLIYFNIDPLLKLMPRGDELTYLKQIFLIIASARLFDLASGVNDQIIAYSKHFKFNFYVLFLLGASNVVLNLFLADHYGFLGIAMATSISLILFNAVKMIFIYVKFGLQPIRLESFKLLFIFLVVYMVSSVTPALENPFLDGLLNCGIVAVLFLPLVFIFKISNSWNQLFLERVKKVFG